MRTMPTPRARVRPNDAAQPRGNAQTRARSERGKRVGGSAAPRRASRPHSRRPPSHLLAEAREVEQVERHDRRLGGIDGIEPWACPHLEPRRSAREREVQVRPSEPSRARPCQRLTSEASRRRLPRTPTRAPRAHGSPPRVPAGALRRGASVSAHNGARPTRVETRYPQPGGRAASAYPRRAHEASRRQPRAGARRTSNARRKRRTGDARQRTSAPHERLEEQSDVADGACNQRATAGGNAAVSGARGAAQRTSQEKQCSALQGPRRAGASRAAHAAYREARTR